ASDYTCSVLTQTACATKGPTPTWMGAGTTCAAVTCPHLVANTPSTGQVGTSLCGEFFNLTASGASPVLMSRIGMLSSIAQGDSLPVEVWTYPGSYVGHDTSS